MHWPFENGFDQHCQLLLNFSHIRKSLEMVVSKCNNAQQLSEVVVNEATEMPIML